ncbi:hypothetical protein SALBM135S_09604 [Streptomyces alboniger]
MTAARSPSSPTPVTLCASRSRSARTGGPSGGDAGEGGAAGGFGAACGAAAGSDVSRSSRCVASAAGLGWSKVTVAVRVTPVRVERRLRSSRAVSESKPRVVKPRSAGTSSAPALPRTVTISARTSRRTVNPRSRSGRASSRSRNGSAPPRALFSRAALAGTSPWNSAGGSVSRSAATSSHAGTRCARSDAARTRSSSARPSSVGSGRMPIRSIRCLSASSSRSVMPVRRSHRPQPRESAGRSALCRWWARASRKALPAA